MLALNTEHQFSNQWRLPSRDDAKKLFADGSHRSCHFFNDLKFCSWLSDSCPKNSKNGYFAYFASGNTSTELKHRLLAVRMVRDVSDQELFHIFNGVDGRFALSINQDAVVDRLTGIAWSRKVILPRQTWFDAKTLAESSQQKS